MNLDTETKIWEIQPERDDSNFDACVLLVDKHQQHQKEDLVQFDGGKLFLCFLTSDDDLLGLIKLYHQAVLEKTSVFTQILRINQLMKGNGEYD